MKTILVLGSTGSIGTQTLDVCRSSPGHFDVVGLAASSSWRAVLEQVEEFSPRFVAMADEDAGEALRERLPRGVALETGPGALEWLARAADYDTAVHGVVGAAGLPASVAVLERGQTLALANKESLVIAGDLLMNMVREGRGSIVPVDSELCALFQCLRGEDLGKVRTIHLTASGGAFRDLPLEELSMVTPEMALRHPNWDMGPRITVGSATLMNKALEVLEVHHLFGLSREQIHVVLHRQSVVHSMVEFVDSSIIAQLGPPDMRIPLHFALHHPERAPLPMQGYKADLFRELNFAEVDPRRYPALELGLQCVELGSDSGSALNAADEVAVEAFLNGTIAFTDIAVINARVLEKRVGQEGSISRLLAADARAREHARAEIRSLTPA